jgi:asparagine synthase (glutamine-hydrolysing)
MAAPMRRGRRLHEESLIDPDGQWALGRLHLSVLQPAPQLSTPGPVKALFHGDLHNEQELRASLEREPGSRELATASSLLAALYERHGASAATYLKGAFCAAVLDETKGALVLFNDLLGSYPIYWFSGPERFVFASELKSILRDPAIPRQLDARAVADFIQFGFVFGDRTLAESARILPSASTLTYRRSDGTCEIRRYRSIAEFFETTEAPKEVRLERLRSSFRRAVERTQSGDQTVGLSLSGGLDTRAILSAVSTTHGPISTYTLGVKGCADDVIAEQLSRVAGTRHRFFELDDRYLSEFLPQLTRMVSLTDGMYLSHGLTEMLALGFLEGSDFPILLRGHCGELAKTSLAWPFHTDQRVQAMREKEELIPYLLQRINYIGKGTALAGLFADDWSEKMKNGPQRSLADSIAKVPLSPVDLCSYLYLEEQHRRFTVPSLELFRNVLEVRLPFADEDFLRDLFATPSPLRDGTDIHRALIGTKLSKVRNSNTGVPLSAGPLVEKAFDKFNTLFKRLNVYGFRHYHNFDSWMKRQLLESVEAVLLDPSTLARGILREAALVRLLGETKTGAADHGYLFQVLLILELWQRECLN